MFVAIPTAPIWALSGVSAKTLQYLMGHSDISITLNVYTHIKFDDAQKEVALIQARQPRGQNRPGVLRRLRAFFCRDFWIGHLL